MIRNSEVARFWERFLETRPRSADGRFYEVFHFGHSERLANALADSVARGLKTATSGLLWEYEAKGKQPPQVGDLSIVTTWSQQPVCIIETTEVRVLPFQDVDARFARDYGEGDRSLQWWRTAMWTYYVQQCLALGRQAAEDMPLVCERFKLVFNG